MYVVTSPLLTEAAALVARDGRPVLVLREDLIGADDLATVRAVCSCLDATVIPTGEVRVAETA